MTGKTTHRKNTLIKASALITGDRASENDSIKLYIKFFVSAIILNLLILK